MTARAQLIQLVENLDETDVPEALHYVRRLVADDRSPIDFDRSVSRDSEASERAEYAKIGSPTSADDPLWTIVGLVGDDYDGPTDVASNKHAYLAEAYAKRHDE